MECGKILIELNKIRKKGTWVMRKVVGLIIAFFLAINLIPIGINGEVSAKAIEKSNEFSGYTPIRTISDLNNIRNNSGGRYYLANDIVFSDNDFAKGGQFYNNGSGWSPIESFSGVLDGNGYSIKNLKIFESSSEYVGLFKVNIGTIRNLGLDKINYNYTYEYRGTSNRVTFYHYTGGLVGDNKGVIENCYNTGDITVSVKHPYGIANVNVAGIAGRNSGRINKCYNESPVKVLVVRGSYSDNDINIAGIVGDNKGTITNSYNAATIGYEYSSLLNFTTDNNAGGIVGYNSGIVRAVYNVGTIIDNFSLINFKGSIGAIVGYNYNNSSISEAYYYDKSCKYGTGNLTSQKTTKRTADKLKLQSSYTGFDFDSTWQIDSSKKYPYATLRGMKKVEITNIRMKVNPTKLDYSKGEELDLTGGVLEVVYEDNTRKDVSLTTDMISGYDNQKIGTQKLIVTYNGKTSYFNIVMKNNAAPIITVDDVTIYIDEMFDVMSGVTANDEEDGNITKKIQVVQNELNINRVGVYNIIYMVSDNNGNTTTKERRVEVISRPIEIDTAKPIIYADDVTLDLGQEFDPLDYAYAADYLDDIVVCEVVKNNVDVYHVGSYEVEYRAMNSKGIESTKKITVTVVDNGKPIIYAESRYVYMNETYNILEGVTAVDKKDGDITNKIVVIGNVNTSKVGEYEITYSVTDSDNNTTEREVIIIVRYSKEDLNKDGLINYEDLEFITRYYNSSSSDARWSWIDEYDMNSDGIIDICDYVILNEKIIGYVMENIDLDFNKDGLINTEDLQCIIDNYNILSNDDRFKWEYDLNVDGIVDICDYIIASEMIEKVMK